MLFQGILLLLCIAVLCLLPEAVTLLIAYDTRCVGWSREARRRVFLSLLIISSCVHLIFAFLIHRLFFQKWNILETIGTIGKMETTCQDMGRFSEFFLLCMVYGIVLGFILHKILEALEKDYGREAIDRRRKVWIVLLISIMGMAATVCYGMQFSVSGKIKINEICSNDETILLDVDGNIRLSDYIELYNGGMFDYRIEGLYLSDNENELKKYEIPAGVIRAGGYLLVLLDGNASFGISRYGETVYLSDRNGNVIDQVDCIALGGDTGYSRVPDGSENLSARECTPGWSNNWATRYLQAPSFSCESGFYGEAFDLVIFSEEDAKIFYTLDGSIPTEQSIAYEGPIRVSDVSSQENKWSMREDISAGFLTDEIKKMGEGAFLPGYRAPDAPVDKCTVLRAVCIDEEGNRSPVASASYFVDYGSKAGYEGMNVLSVMTDPDNLFDNDRGIYVLGSVYDAYKNSDHPQWIDSDWEWWSANYTQRGRDWEREACLQFFDTGGKLLLSKEGGIRIQGGRTRGKAQKSLNLYARKEYDGQGRFQADFFGSGYEPKRMTLFTGADDNIAKIKDYMMSCIMGSRHFSMMEFVPYVMFLDGEYWGCYWLTEKYDDKYFQYHYGVDAEDVVMIKHGMIEVGNEEDLKLYQEMRSFLINTDLAVDRNYQKACELVDMESLIDYYAAEIYIGRYGDWPSGNFALWRTREEGIGTYGDGRWRWILFDVNSGSMEYFVAENDTLAEVMEKDELFASLMENEKFREQFRQVILDMARTEFLPEKTEVFIDDYRATMGETLQKEYERFYGGIQERTMDLDYIMEDMKKFFVRRYDYITQRFDGDFMEDLSSVEEGANQDDT
ncbi:MAG: hypothetical protein HFI94_06885 [Lachnospiraceae bacterium]|nr:hypothetical protein [Lachnospiraceae bacterium]